MCVAQMKQSEHYLQGYVWAAQELDKEVSTAALLNSYRNLITVRPHYALDITHAISDYLNSPSPRKKKQPVLETA